MWYRLLGALAALICLGAPEAHAQDSSSDNGLVISVIILLVVLIGGVVIFEYQRRKKVRANHGGTDPKNMTPIQRLARAVSGYEAAHAEVIESVKAVRADYAAKERELTAANARAQQAIRDKEKLKKLAAQSLAGIEGEEVRTIERMKDARKELGLPKSPNLH
jgi:hypothetical protein